MPDNFAATHYHDYYLVSTEYPFTIYETLKRLSNQFQIEVVAVEGMALPTINKDDLERLARSLHPSVLFLVKRSLTMRDALDRLEALFDAMEHEEGMVSTER